MLQSSVITIYVSFFSLFFFNFHSGRFSSRYADSYLFLIKKYVVYDGGFGGGGSLIVTASGYKCGGGGGYTGGSGAPDDGPAGGGGSFCADKNGGKHRWGWHGYGCDYFGGQCVIKFISK